MGFKEFYGFNLTMLDKTSWKLITKAPFSSRKFSTLSKIQNMKIFNVF